MGSSFLWTDKPTYLLCFVLLPLLPLWLLPSPSPLDPQLTDPLPQLMLLLLTTLLLMPNTPMKPPSLMLSNTELPMNTPELISVLQKLLMAKLSLDLTKLPFPMVVSKPSPTPLITTMVMLLMSNTKVPQSTPRPSLTTLPLPQAIMPKKWPETSTKTLLVLSLIHVMKFCPTDVVL